MKSAGVFAWEDYGSWSHVQAENPVLEYILITNADIGTCRKSRAYGYGSLRDES